ncbi:MAG: cyanophycin synthetase [Bacillota bacterium]
MHILAVRAHDGPNIHCHRPVIELLVDLLEHVDTYTDSLPSFPDRLVAALPGLAGHHCSRGYPGGFLERLTEGTLLGHAVEHVALELLNLAGVPVTYGKTRRVGDGSVFRVVYECGCDGSRCGLAAAPLAVDVVQRVLAGELVDIGSCLQALGRARLSDLGPTTSAIAAAARRRGIPVMRLSSDSLVQLGQGHRRRLVRASLTDATSCLAADIACDKAETKDVLGRHGLPVPPGGVALSEREALALVADLGPPVVLKPVDANQGKGVALDLRTDDEVLQAFAVARQFSPRIIVERYIPGRHFRLLVIDGRLAAAAERLPATLTGDGNNTVTELIAALNSDPRRGLDHERPLTRVSMDEIVRLTLARQGLTVDSVPEAGRLVVLRPNANLSTGGTARDVTAEVHPSQAQLAVAAAAALGLDVAGVDLVAPDISVPAGEEAVIIEVNAAPGLRMHLHPCEGQPRDVAADIVDYLFPGGADGCIPVIAVTGTNGKTTVVRLIDRLLQATGLRTARATTDGIYLQGRLIAAGDMAGPASAGRLLMDPGVEAAVLETARGGIIRGGLGFDRCDVAVLTNVSADHLECDGIETMEDMAAVKCLITEVVKPAGASVLNADDPQVMAVAARARGRRILFSMVPDNLSVRRHVDAGGTAVYVRRGQVLVRDARGERSVGPVADFPLTLGGRAAHNVENVLAAVGAGVGLGLAETAMGAVLRSFQGNEDDNPGRFTLFAVGACTVVVDYGHNPSAVRAVVNTARRLGPGRLIGVLGAPGDRADAALYELGRVAGNSFHHLVIREDRDLRGRQPGETAALLRAGAQGGVMVESMDMVLDEVEAVRTAVGRAQPGDIVLVFYEHYGPVAAAVKGLARAAGGLEAAVGGPR